MTKYTLKSEDTVIYTSTRLSLAGTLRARLLGKGKGRADDAMRPISTAPGVIGAGETETEGEDTVSTYLNYMLLNPRTYGVTCHFWTIVRCF